MPPRISGSSPPAGRSHTRPRGESLGPPAAERLVTLARIGKAHGLQGELKLEILGGTGGTLRKAARVFIGSTQLDARMMGVEGLRGAPGRALLKLAGIDTPDRAKMLTGARVFLRRSDFPPARKGEYYWVDLVGLRVRTPDEDLGVVEEVVETPAFDVLVVRGRAGGRGPRVEHLIPFTRSALREVCPGEGVLRVQPPQAWEVPSEDPALARKPPRAPRGKRGGGAAGRPGGLRSRRGGK